MRAQIPIVSILAATAISFVGCGDSSERSEARDENGKLREALSQSLQEKTSLTDKVAALQAGLETAAKAAEARNELEKEAAKEISQLRDENKKLNAAFAAAASNVVALAARVETLESSLRAAKEKARQNDNEWTGLIDRVLIALDRVTKEKDTFSSATFKSDLANEERRLQSLSREQEATARTIVSELRSKGFPNADKLERQVESFASNYGFYVSYSKLQWERLKTLGSVPKNIEENVGKFMSAYYENIRNIGAMKADMKK